MTTLHRNSDNQIIPNFTERQLFSTSPDAPDTHELSTAVIIGLSIIRQHFGLPMRRNSSYRTPIHNAAIGGVSDSQHVLKKAIDADFIDNPDFNIERYSAEIDSKGTLYAKLRLAGITGIGLYDNFLHIDTRNNKFNSSDEFGQFAFWDNRKKKI